MGIRSALSKPFAKYVVAKQQKWALDPAKYQQLIFDNLVQKGGQTIFGKDHKLSGVNSYQEFKQAVPINDYEGLKPYMDQMVQGKSDVLWPGKPAYFAKTSGTTSGVKYIPITKDSIPNHINSARDALLSYVNETGNGNFLDGKLIFLSGSPVLGKTAGVYTGRLSGIVNHHVPGYLKTNQMPSYETNCIDDWEEKLARIIDETIAKDMSLISGIPPWVQMYFDKIIERTGRPIKDVFPNFNMFVYGGVNFQPYRKKLFESIGKEIPSIETYPASEGFIAYQDSQEEEGLLLLSNSGIFYEFIPADEYYNDNPTRLRVEEVEIGVNYAVIINSNAGLWGYSIGDTVKFVSTYPHRLLVTGRIKHFISAFGEHVIGEEVENAMQETTNKFPEVEIVEFTVAPNVAPEKGIPRHEWFIEFRQMPNDLASFQNQLDLQLQKLNTYYFDLVSGNVLSALEIIPLKNNSFRNYMKSIGKLGGQNKVPRLSNDRKLADELIAYRK
ncbi:MAG: GH3 auxin-responsive promoter family protein [Cyclobacteriaceae bacterium]|nr:GH3 auxin-responsive promoter family protein [Cyclobacteriaceae bacterium]